jgi:hypothetical protein
VILRGSPFGVNRATFQKSRRDCESIVQRRPKQIAEHEGKIANPESVVKDWASRSKQYQEGLINKWSKDIARQKQQQEILQHLKDVKSN